VIEDRPYLLHDHYINPVDGLTSNYDITRNEFISSRHTPFSADASSINGGHSKIDNAWEESITKALNSIKGETASLGNSLGELKTTVDSFAASGLRGFNFIKAMKKGRWRQAGDILGLSRKEFTANRGNALADYWLAYSYGWAPLAGEMFALQRTFAEATHRTSRSVEGNGTSIVSDDVEFPYNDFIEKGSFAARVRTTLKAELTNPYLALINDLGLTNPLSVAWELVPFSFVVDWFLPVGNTLEAMTAGLGLEWKGGYISKSIRKAIHITHKEGRMTDWTDCVDPGSYRERSSEFQRVALTGFPYARFYADMTPYSTPRAVNALALIRKFT
jgi:hypothetical protein